MVFPHHQIFRGFAAGARPARPLAREGAPDAAQLDRPLGGAARALRARSRDDTERGRRARGLHHPPRHVVRCQVHGALARSSAGGGRRGQEPRARHVHRRMQTHGTAQELIDTAEKMGFDTGMKALHPFDPTWKLPVYVANFIVMDYGTGAIFGCPAHDQRDLDFVNKYGLGNTPVVCPPGQDASTFVITDTAYDVDGRMINSRFLDGMTVDEAKKEVARRLEHESRGNRPVGTRQVNFRLRDWGISRQRYWGCPIPVIHCERCGIVPVPESDLPVTLPDDVDFDRP